MGHRQWIAGLIALGAMLAVPAAAAADDRYAEPNGNGPSGDMQCLIGNPCDIQDAVEDASVADGDHIILLAGPYNLGTDPLLIADDIAIEPAPGLPRQTLNSTFATSGWAVGVEASASAPGAVLRRLLISHGSGGASLPQTLFLKDATAERVYVVSDGIIGCSVTSGTLRDSVCFLTAAANSAALGAVGASVGGAVTQQSTVRNVTAISKEPNAPGLVLSAVAGANLSLNGLNVIAESPTFDVFASAPAGSTATISLGNSNYPTFDDAGAGGSVTSNAVSGNQATPPQFANFAGNNFAQASTSPTIDAGAVDSLIGALDVDGNPRVVQGKANCSSALPDIGAYEAPTVTPIACPTVPSTNPSTAPTTAPPKCRKAKRKKGKGKPRAAAAKKKKKRGCGKKRRKKR